MCAVWPHNTDRVAEHGLSSEALQAAASRIENAVPFRWCFVVVKDGVLVHESYFHNNSETLYRTQVSPWRRAPRVDGHSFFFGDLVAQQDHDWDDGRRSGHSRTAGSGQANQRVRGAGQPGQLVRSRDRLLSSCTTASARVVGAGLLRWAQCPH